MRGRAKHAPNLPLVAKPGKDSILAAIRKGVANNKGSLPQAGGDTVELVETEHLEKEGLVVLLFHRASPDAADPAYRKKVNNKVQIRQTKKQRDEEQTVSCHLVIKVQPVSPGEYDAVLEEIPGLSLSAVSSIFGVLLNEYKYAYQQGGEDKETYVTLKAEGMKSEFLTDALKKKSSLRYLTLTRAVPIDAPDAEGLAEPQNERVRYRIVGNPASPQWRKKLSDFVTGSKADWDQVSIDIALDDNRSRTVRLDKEDETAELLFVRSELEYLGGEVVSCSLTTVPLIIKAAKKVLSKKLK